jgi:hypothetical protein
MKHAQSSSSFHSFENDCHYNNETSTFSTRKSMVPIRELDFESRIMLNFKIPKRKSYSEQMRKNDYVIDLINHDENNFLNTNQNVQNLNNIEGMKSCFNGVNSDNEDTAYESIKNNNKRKLKHFRRFSHHHHSAPHSNQHQPQHQAKDYIQNNEIKLNNKATDSFRDRLKSQSDNLTMRNQNNKETAMYANPKNNASQQFYTDFKTIESTQHPLEEDSIYSNDFSNSCNLS